VPSTARLEGSVGWARLLWVLPLAFAAHELEEWNIAPWLRANFTPATELTDLAARTLLVAFALAALAYTGAVSLLASLRARLWLLLPLFVVVALGNAVQHVYWAASQGAYAPGVITSAFAVVPAVAYVSLRAVRERLLPAWYVGLLHLLALLPVLVAARLGRTLSPEQLALHRTAVRLAAWLWGSA
jgi:hypothetical protein